MKRILLLADINSSHLKKSALALKVEGFEVAIFSLSKALEDWYTENNITHFTGLSKNKKDFLAGDLFKLSYLKAIRKLKNSIQTWRPEIVHAHYASSYGLLGALSGFQNYFISVWGSDVFEFPKKSILHKYLIKFNLAHARLILSASEIMASAARKYSKVPVKVIPFGIDTHVFSPSVHGNDTSKELTIGTIKSLEPVYGIDVLIKSFAIVNRKVNSKKLKLLIIGAGSQMDQLKKLASSLSLSNVEFRGAVEFNKVPECHREIDIFVNLSYMESFGVSVLEAMSSGKPVLVSRAGGLIEITDDDCALYVETGDVEHAATALERLVLNAELRQTMGMHGRNRVEEFYQWSNCVKMMKSIYNQEDYFA